MPNYWLNVTLLGLPFIAPELALLYKAKRPAKENNTTDFQAALPALDTVRRLWLRTALETCYPNHIWLNDF